MRAASTVLCLASFDSVRPLTLLRMTVDFEELNA